MHGKGANAQVRSSKSISLTKSPLFKSDKNCGSDPLRYTGPKLLRFEGEIRHPIILMDLSFYLLRSWYQTQNPGLPNTCLTFKVSIPTS